MTTAPIPADETWFLVRLDVDHAWSIIAALRFAGEMELRAGDLDEARRLLRIANLIELRTIIHEETPA